MVGFVIVSHSAVLAEGVVELASMMAPEVQIRAAGGMDGGGLGTSFGKIQAAIEEIYTSDGVIVLVDMGSAAMTTEMVIELMPSDMLIKMVDCPLVEGAVAGTVNAAGGMEMEELIASLAEVATTPKF